MQSSTEWCHFVCSCFALLRVRSSEMQEFVKSVSGEANLPLVPDEQLDFTMKLYDLNQVLIFSADRDAQRCIRV